MDAVDARNLTKHYRRRGGTTTVVDDVSLVAVEGEVLGILGPNGAGKTTTVEMVAGVRRPDHGSVRVLGLDPFTDRAAVRQVLGVQLQSGFLHGALTVRELAHLYRTFYPAGRDPDELVATLGLEEQRDVRYERLSGGQQQRVAIVLALVGDPRVVILDELTTGLDPQARRQVWGVVEGLRDGGATVLLVSHLMEEVERLCDRVTLIESGRVVAHDTPAGLVASAGLDQRVRFRVAEPLPPALLDRVPGVDEVAVRGEQVVVTGHGDLLQEVSTALVRAGVVATETRLERATLDDAFLALTGRPLTEVPTGDPRATTAPTEEAA
ncbi:ABC transporter ATP-binding protein [Cellulosimicrobium sp. NPDC055967]|uniref:ABC transporter ATP-binding protein n=1 Tax=Cellulosimicrobium sp. NPDC055967 TaxID=3345670 RepID=UPI0035DC47F3